MKTENHITDSKLARFSTRAHWSFFSCLFEQQFPTSQNIWATTVANLCYQLDENTKLPYYTLPPTQNHSFFRNFPTLLQMFWLWILQIQQSIRLDIARGLLMVIGIQWKTSDNGSLAHSCIL